jgi:chromosomal replication initiation ATPase DnaA
VTPTTQAIWDELGARELHDIVRKHATHHQVLVDELLGPSHERAAAWARQSLWAELYSLGHWSTPRLAKLFRKDKGTIWTGIRAHERRTMSEPIQSQVRIARSAARMARKRAA